MILMIDNYDSFTYNLVQYCGELGHAVDVHRNDAITIAQIEALAPAYIIVSPGPCTPNEAGISMQVISHFAGRIPLLGVCLGHQSMAQSFGGKIVRARAIMHGKTSPIYHAGTGLFAGLDNPFIATRYHSLVAEQSSLPDCFEITAWTNRADGSFDEIMGIAHKTLPIFGVQFHPESILTVSGHQILANFFDASAQAA
jgi:anthranilate synthase component II